MDNRCASEEKEMRFKALVFVRLRGSVSDAAGNAVMNNVNRIASKLRDTLTWDTLYSMVDVAVLEYLDLNETHYGETAGDEPAKTYEKNRQQFKIVKLESPSWTIDVPVRKNK